jgi:NDP-sugar pyrophosphorylase family protein
MPVLDENENLADIYLWDEMFSEKFESNIYKKKNLEIPVVIIAGGKGSRLRPLTNIIPKPLIPIGKKTILEKIIDNFCTSGFDTFYVSINYMSHMIESYFENLEEKNYNLHFYKEDEPKGTAGSLSLIRDKISTPFFVSNCDILIDQDYNEVFAYHQEQKNDITAITAVKNFKLPYGSFEMNKNGVITHIIEKPEFTFYVNAGMYIIEPHLLEVIPTSGVFHITDLIAKTMKAGGKVGIFPVGEKSWIDIGEWNLYEKLLKE